MKRKRSNPLKGTIGDLMVVQPPDRVSVQDTRRLPQRKDKWECAVRRARLWITPPDSSPYRPYAILTASRSGMIVGMDLTENPPSPDEALNALAKAMLYPILGAGTRRRPAAVYLDDDRLVAALRQPLAEIGVSCEFRHSLRAADRALHSFESELEQGSMPSLVENPGVTKTMVGALFEAAAFFYQEAPWQWISDAQPIQIHHPLDSQPRYAVVMGQGEVAYGLALYDSKDILHETYAGSPEDDMVEGQTWTVLLFGDEVDVPFDDLDAIEAYGWPIAGPHAYPLVLRASNTEEAQRPSKSDLLRLEAALRTLPRFVQSHMRADEGLGHPAEATFTVEVAGREDRISLSYPVPGFETHLEDLWFADPDAGGFYERNDQLIHFFESWLQDQGLSPGTIQKHVRNLDRFAFAYLLYEGGSIGYSCPADEAAPADIDEFLADWLPDEVYGSPEAAVKSHIASLKKFYRCLAEIEEMSADDADEIVDLLRQDRAYYIDLARDLEE